MDLGKVLSKAGSPGWEGNFITFSLGHFEFYTLSIYSLFKMNLKI